MPETPPPALPTAAAVVDPLPVPRQSAVRTALAGLIGNVLEWFDFAVYGYFSSAIAGQFFPKSDPTAQLLLANAVFALGFAARPAGSIVLGIVGDRIGRRALLTLSIALMGGATLGIGLMPNYNQIGVAAPILLLVMRMIQGFSLGGEFTGSMVYTTELADQRTRGLISSSTAAGTTLGFILGSASSLIVEASLGKAAADSWGWRIPFIASVSFCVAGYFLRKGIHEPPQGEKAAALRPPVIASLISDWLPIVRTVGIAAMTNAAYYITFQFIVERRKSAPGAAATNFLLINTIVLFVVLFAKPLGGWLSDKYGRRRMMIGLTIAMMPLFYFAFDLMAYGTTTQFLIGQIMMAVPLGLALGLQGAMVVEIFPLRTRVMSMSIAYSVTLALAGGTAGLVSTWLIDVLGHPMWPAYYVIIYGLLGIAIMWPMRETNTNSLDV